MQSRLISCDCLYNPYQTLPYDQCDYTNKGCRQCASTQYQDDLYARCTACGSECPLGFRAFNASLDAGNTAVKSKYKLTSLNLCGPGVSTSQDLSFADPLYDPIAYGMDQIKMGCVPCDCGALNAPQQVVFVLPGCHWVCKRDPTNQSESDYYCKKPLNPLLGTCDQQCLDCQGSLSSLVLPSSSFGFYIQSCQDGVGHLVGNCTSKPTDNAFYTSNSPHVGDSKGCSWQCNRGFQLLRGTCVQCLQQLTTCAGGQAQVLSISFHLAPSLQLIPSLHICRPSCHAMGPLDISTVLLASWCLPIAAC